MMKSRFRAVFFRIFLGGINIHPTAYIASKAALDKINPKGIYIGQYTTIAHGAIILTHDAARSKMAETKIGLNCFIGVNSIILPGITVGDHVIVGAGSVVTKDIPPCSVAVGNPARIIGKHGELKKYGQR